MYVLSMTGRHVTDETVLTLATLTALTTLGLRSCRNVTNERFQALRSFTVLTDLDLMASRHLSDDEISALSNLTAPLTNLHLFSCRQVTDQALLPLASLNLHLGRCKRITHHDKLQALDGLTSLRILR